MASVSAQEVQTHAEKHIHAVGICLQRGSFFSPPHTGSVARCEVFGGQISAYRRELGLLHISTVALGVIVASWPPCKLHFFVALINPNREQGVLQQEVSSPYFI